MYLFVYYLFISLENCVIPLLFCQFHTFRDVQSCKRAPLPPATAHYHPKIWGNCECCALDVKQDWICLAGTSLCSQLCSTKTGLAIIWSIAKYQCKLSNLTGEFDGMRWDEMLIITIYTRKLNVNPNKYDIQSTIIIC